MRQTVLAAASRAVGRAENAISRCEQAATRLRVLLGRLPPGSEQAGRVRELLHVTEANLAGFRAERRWLLDQEKRLRCDPVRPTSHPLPGSL